MQKRKIVIIMLASILAIVFVVLMSTNSNTAKKMALTPTKIVTLSAPNIVKVKDVMKKLTAEKQVSGSQIFIKDNIHHTVITFNKDADIKTAKAVATKYANLIKEAYNDKNVNVQIVQNGKNIANVVLK